MFLRLSFSIVLLCLPCLLPAVEILDFVPSNARQVFRIDLSNDLAGLNDVRNDLLTTVSRQSGFDEKERKSPNISKLLNEIVIVTPNLTEDFSFILVKTKVTEKVFCSELEKMTGLPLKSVKTEKQPEYRIEFKNFGFGPLLMPKKRSFAFAFLSDNIAVMAKDSLRQFRSFVNLGLRPNDRKLLMTPKIIAAGFVKMDPDFLLENPLVPPFVQADCVLAPGPASSLQVTMNFASAEQDDAKQLQKFLQQMVMVGAMLLNQTDEDLMQEWMTSINVKREHTVVTVKALFSRYFITRLAEQADRQLTAPATPSPAAPPAPPVKAEKEP